MELNSAQSLVINHQSGPLLIVAGAGISGALAALRLAVSRTADLPSLKILLVEKEAVPGGRLRSYAGDAVSVRNHQGEGDATKTPAWGYGLNGVSKPLIEFWQQTMRADPDSVWDPDFFAAKEQCTLGILSGSDLSTLPLNQMFAGKGARALGGMAAARQWDHVTNILNANRQVDSSLESPTTLDSGESVESVESVESLEAHESVEAKITTAKSDGKADQKSFAQVWTESRKSPAAVVLEQFCPVIGITDLWSTPPEAFCERVRYHTGPLKRGPWQVAITEALQKYIDAGIITLTTNCRVMAATLDSQWQLTTTQGSFAAARLIVAQPPWQALSWLPKHHWPASLLAMASKIKPVSAVTLTERLEKSAAGDLPDLIMIPAEGVQAIRSSEDEITFQATIDFEISVQAPEVVKAVKRLKRARKKLLSARAGCMSDHERIALVTVAWGQSAAVSETKLLRRMTKSAINSAKLAFCGDCYGASYVGDENVIKSVVSATSIIGQSLQQSLQQ